MQIFISYGRQDALEFAEKLAEWLKEQGFEFWLDKKDRIKLGEPFDILIEQGISESQLLIALISPWSIRHESFCRNEWLYAQSIEKPIIPIRLANINPPLVIINLQYEDAFNDPEQIFSKLLTIIEDISRKGKSKYRDWILKDDSKPWWSQREKINFDRELGRYSEFFTGREWLVKQLKTWVESNNSQMALIIAETGLGKSAIAAHLALWLNVRNVHFCTSSNIKTCEPVEWIRDLIYQLAAQFETYRDEMEKRTVEPNWGGLPESLFRTLVIDPLSGFEKDHETDEPWVFVIDSLDESLAVAGEALIDLLALSVNILPTWIKIIATCRPHQTIVSRFSIDGVTFFELKASDQRNKQDLHNYIYKRLDRWKGKINLSTLSEVVDRIADLAEGNFQYAKVLIDSLQNSGEINIFLPDQFEKFPLNLVGLYDRLFRKRFKDINSYRNDVLPLINCLIAAKEPLQKEFLIRASKLDESIANNALLALSQFLNCTDSGLRLFHKSIIDWLSDLNLSTDFIASKTKGIQFLADACWIEFRKNPMQLSCYCRKYIALHLTEDERWDELLKIVNHPELKLIRTWTDGGQGTDGIYCLRGLIGHLVSQNRDKITTAGLATQLARIYSLWGNYAQARSWLDLALKKTSIFFGRRIKAVALHELGSLFLYYRSHNEAFNKYKQALHLCNLGRPKYYDEAASNLIGLATISYEKYRLNRAIKFSKKAISRAKKAEDLHHIIAAERMIGAVYKRMGNFQEALSHLDNAMAMTGLVSSVKEIYQILLLQGWLELDMAAMKGANTEKARPLFERALGGAKISFDYYNTKEALLSLGWTYLKENNVSEAKQFLNLAFKDLDFRVHPELKASGDSWQVFFFYLKQEYHEALEKGLVVIKTLKKFNLRGLEIRLLIILGSIYWYINKIQKAEGYWKEAFKVSKSISKKRFNLTLTGIEMCKKDPFWIPQ